MAKKAKNKIKKNIATEMPENVLPQNILPIGERVEENKNIYISQKAYKEIHNFTENKTTNESGGMLVGSVIEEFGKTNIVISGFVEAKHCDSTPTTLKFTHETWEHVHKEIEKKHKGKKIVGWIHTHPDFGIFLSEYDRFIHQNFFNEDHQVAYVVDPIQNIEGFYFWINGKIEKCKGFYIYDKTGVNIDVDVENDEVVQKEDTTIFSGKNILLAILSVAVVFLIFSNISTNNKLEKIESQQRTLVDSANQSLAYMHQLISSQTSEIEGLNSQIEDLSDILSQAGIFVKPESEPTIPGGETIDDSSDNSTSDNSTSDDDATDESTDDSADASTDDSADASTDDSADASTDDSADVSTDDSTNASTDDALQEPNEDGGNIGE